MYTGRLAVHRHLCKANEREVRVVVSDIPWMRLVE